MYVCISHLIVEKIITYCSCNEFNFDDKIPLHDVYKYHANARAHIYTK